MSHPAHIQDVAAAFAWVKRNIRQHGGDSDRVIVIGHSAGAYLAALLATDSRYLAAHKLSPQLDGESEETSSSILLFAKRVLSEKGK